MFLNPLELPVYGGFDLYKKTKVRGIGLDQAPGEKAGRVKKLAEHHVRGKADTAHSQPNRQCFASFSSWEETP